MYLYLNMLSDQHKLIYLLNYHKKEMSLISVKQNLLEDKTFDKHRKEYILKIIDYLLIRNYISRTYCYSGWSVFHKPTIVKKMDEYIILDTINCKKKLALMLQLTNSKDFPYEPELLKKICDLLKFRLKR